MLTFAGFMFLAGWLLRPLYGVNKIGATPSWCLWSSAYTLAAWALLYRFIDAGHGLGALRPISAVGSNALFAYIFPSMVYYLFTLAGIGYYSVGKDALAVALTRSVIFTAVMMAFAGWIGRRGLRLKL
jgi:predicted acyltransferase